MSYDAQLDLLAPADALATRLESIAELDGVEVIVDREKNLEVAIQAATAKLSGAAILITLDGFRNEVEDGGELALDIDYSISLWTNLVFESGNIPPSVAAGAMARAIQGWRPSGGNAGYCHRWRVRDAQRGVGKRHRVFELIASYRIDIPAE